MKLREVGHDGIMKPFLLPLLLTMALYGMASAAGTESNESFTTAKRLLEREVYADHRVTVYCGYEFDEEKRICLPEGFTTDKHKARAARMEWEHAVPAENFGRAFAAWREGAPVCVDSKGKPYKGRRCAEKASREYRLMQADMYNLFPAVGAVNAVRSNRQYSELPGVPSAFGTCPAKVDGKRFEPPPQAKGELARAGLYMEQEYPEFRLSRQQKRLFEAWSRQDPVDAWECTRTRRIEKLQGNENSVVKKLCTDAGLW